MRPPRPCRLCCWLPVAATLVVVAAAVAAPAEELADAAARADYAFYTADRAALARLVRLLAPYAGSADRDERYTYALAEFRALQLASLAHAERDAEEAAQGCEQALEGRGAPDAEGLALGAACAAYEAGLGRLTRLTAASRREARLEAARALAPDNPRVLLVAALRDWFARGASAEAARAARAALSRAAEAFERTAEATPPEPQWGAAEAWLFVGRALVEAGDLLGARSAYERALIVAPDFAVARRELAALAAGH